MLEVASGLDAAALSAAEPSGARARFVHDALREALFFWLCLAGERLGREVDEALGLSMKQRLAPLEALVSAATP